MITAGSNSHRIEKLLGAVVESAAASFGMMDVRLYHGSEESRRLLQPWRLSEAPSREDLLSLAEDIDRQALEDVETHGWNAQEYLVDVRDGRSGDQLGSVSLRYTSSALTTDGVRGAELIPANGPGLTGLAMQQSGNNQKAMLAAVGMALENATRQQQRSDVQLDKLSNMVLRLFELMEETASRRLEREMLAAAQKQEAELRYRKETAQLDRAQYLVQTGVDKIGALLPIIANRLAGGNQLGASATTRDLLVSSLLESLTSEQQQALKSTLTDTQMATLFELAEAVTKVRGEVKKTANPGPVTGQMREIEKKLTEAVDYFKDTLLPWAMERVRKGEVPDPRQHSDEAVAQLSLMLRSLAPAEFTALVSEGSPLGEAERKAFSSMAEAMRNPPAAAAKPAETSKNSGGASK